MPEWLSSLLVIAATTLIAGGLGGLIATKYALRQIRLETKFQTQHQDQLEKRERIKDLLQMLPVIFRDIHLNWELPNDSPETSAEHIEDLQQKLNNARAIFIADQELIDLTERIRALICLDNKAIIESGGPMAGARTIALQEELEAKLREIEARLYS